MISERRQAREIDGKGRTVRELLGGHKYSIDYYQREYKRQTKQVEELINDLAGKFLESYEDGHERSAVADYGHYFLGSIIVSDKQGQKFIIDGQQRLTTLTLLLIFIQHQLADSEQKGQVADLIFSQRFGKRSFNLDIPERHAGEFRHPSDFEDYRNRIGGLLLLPKTFNASYGDLPYAGKRKHYVGHNLLARSLHEDAYDHNPGFSRFIKTSGLEFQPHAKFEKADLDERQALYRQLAEQVWRPERLAQEAAL